MPNDISRLLNEYLSLGGEEKDIPDEYRCPLDRNLLVDPIVLPTGQTCNRSFIVEWINAHHNNPFDSGKALREGDLSANLLITNLISIFLQDRIAKLQAERSKKVSVAAIPSTMFGTPSLADSVGACVPTLSSSPLTSSRDKVILPAVRGRDAVVNDGIFKIMVFGGGLLTHNGEKIFTTVGIDVFSFDMNFDGEVLKLQVYNQPTLTGILRANVVIFAVDVTDEEAVSKIQVQVSKLMENGIDHRNLIMVSVNPNRDSYSSIVAETKLYSFARRHDLLYIGMSDVNGIDIERVIRKLGEEPSVRKAICESISASAVLSSLQEDAPQRGQNPGCTIA